jgi:hypothetical protein
MALLAVVGCASVGCASAVNPAVDDGATHSLCEAGLPDIGEVIVSPAGRAYIEVRQYDHGLSPPWRGWDFMAIFDPPDPRETITEAGPCEVVVGPGYDDRPATAVSSVTAEWSGGSEPGYPYLGLDNGYQPCTLQASLAPGSPISIHVVGSDPATFTVSGSMPSTIAVTSPLPDAAGSLALNLDSDLSIQWSGAPPEVRVFLFGRDTLQSGVSIRCFFPGDAGVATVPAALLQQLRGRTHRGLDIDPVDHHSLLSGAWSVSYEIVQLTYEVSIPDG